MRKIASKGILVMVVSVLIIFHCSVSQAQDESRKNMTSESSGFPAFIRSLPEAEPGPPPNAAGKIRRWLMQGDPYGQVLFVELDIDGTVPFHKHGDQWGIVIEGKLEITMDGHTKTYSRGDTYFIPAGTLHQVRGYAGMKTVEFFADQERWRPRPRSK